MNKKAAINALDRYLGKCNESLCNTFTNDFGNEYVSFSDFNIIKTSVISLFKSLKVDDSFIRSIEKFNGQKPYEIETIRDYIIEVRDQIETEMYDDVSTPLLKEYDVFLSHANSDKKTFVNELYQELSKMNISIFYDESSISWGDNWEERINNALEKCEFAIVIISKNFFDREWTEKELNTLLERKNTLGQKLVLPVIHNVQLKTIKKKYPRVASIQSLTTEKYSQKDIAILFAKELIERIKGKKVEK